VQGQVNDKKLTIVASSSPKRSELEPNIPTAAEAGVPGYEVTSWNGVFAPKGTSKEIVETMNQAMREVLAMPEVKAKFANVGVLPNPSTPEELLARVTADIKKYTDIVDKAGIERK
jgi:tripartite-type tricarboxylate transporter receptor subunit TctC